jgi:hypothetical protein
MPLLEVLYSGTDRLESQRKQAFVKEATKIFQEVLGTPPGRLQFFFLETCGAESVAERQDDDSDSSTSHGTSST